MCDSIDSEIRKLAQGSVKISFWGAYSLDTNRIFVSRSAADHSSVILKSLLARRVKAGDK